MKNKLKESLYGYEGCIRTYTGVYFNVSAPDPFLICVEDMAHALSMIPRFAGHLFRFYSVAEHCLNCVRIAHREDKPLMLIHDGSEGYGLLDIPSPIKKQIPGYYEFEERVMKAICEHCGVKWEMTPTMKKTDADMLQIEWDCIVLRKYKKAWIYRTEIGLRGLLFSRRRKTVEKEFIKTFNNLFQNVKH